ncbi:MAG TPA: DUF4397 domain-containing protein [Candidatus Koribacter sp.]
MTKFAILGLALVSGLFFAAGCGGGSNSSSSTAQLRVVNAVEGPVYNVLVGGNSFATNLGFKGSTAYASIASGSEQIEYRGTTGSTTDVINQTVSLTGATNYTFVAIGSNVVNGALYTDQNTAATSGDFDLRIINAATSLGPADIYIVPSTGNCGDPAYLFTVSANISGLNVGQASAYKQFKAGSFNVCVTAHDAKSLLLQSGVTAYTSGQVSTIIVTDSDGNLPLQFISLTDLAGS